MLEQLKTYQEHEQETLEEVRFKNACELQNKQKQRVEYLLNLQK